MDGRLGGSKGGSTDEESLDGWKESLAGNRSVRLLTPTDGHRCRDITSRRCDRKNCKGGKPCYFLERES